MPMINFKRILIIFVIIGFLSSAIVGFQRHQFEKENNYVDITMDFKDLKQTVGAWDMNKALAELKKAGVTSISIFEMTLDSLEKAGEIKVYNGGELINSELFDIDKKFLDPNYTYIYTFDNEKLDFLEYNLTKRFTEDRIEVKSLNEGYLITLKARKTNNLMDREIGFDFKEFEIVKEAGFNIIPRIGNNMNFSREYIENLFNELDKYPISALIFTKNEVLGYPDAIHITAENIREANIPFGLIESLTGGSPNLIQAGMERLAVETGYNATRVFSLSEDEMQSYPPKEVLDKWNRSTERNNRIIYTRTFRRPDSFPEENIELTSSNIDLLNEWLIESGHELGKVQGMGDYKTSKILLILMGFAGVSAGLLLLNEIFKINERLQLLLFVILTLLITALMFSHYWILNVVLLALGISIIFPTLSILWGVKEAIKTNKDNSLIKIILLFIKVSAITILGSLLVAGLLSDIQFFLKLQIFRGVKIAFIMPFIILAFSYIVNSSFAKKSDYKEMISNTLIFLEKNIKIKHLILIGIGGFVMLVYITRSGNLPFTGVLNTEMVMRNFLENVFEARPRTKEFLIGHPLLIFLIFIISSGKEELFLPFALGASVGQISIINTFSHLHIPLVISLYRTFYGMIIGIILGLALIMIWKLIIKLIKLWGIKEWGM